MIEAIIARGERCAIAHTGGSSYSNPPIRWLQSTKREIGPAGNGRLISTDLFAVRGNFVLWNRIIGLSVVLTLLVSFTGCPPANPVAETTDATEPTDAVEPSDDVGDAVEERSEEIADKLQPAEPTDGDETAPPQEPGKEPTDDPGETEPETKAPSEEPATQEPKEPAGEATAIEKVDLTSVELTSGIPGEGELTIEQIKAWLADDANHTVLEVTLPLGLAAGASEMKIPADNQLTRAKIELGRQLFFDRRLSSDGTISCADCHAPDRGYAHETRFGVGVDGQEGNRNSPVSYNRILSGPQFWDGRAASLEEQAVGPIANPIEMSNTHDVAVETVKKNEGYRIQFEKIFDDGVSIDNIGKAIASFERVIVTGPSPYDYYEPLRTFEIAFADDLEDLEEFEEEDPKTYATYIARKKASDANPMSDSAKRGREIFFSDKGSCTACHVGANFTDEKYHNLGVGMDQDEPDLGRFVVTKEEKDRGAFKTPTVRNIELTAPYMHDGSQATLEEVVEWYAKGGHPNPHLSKDIKKLELTDQDKKDLVAFMKALTGDFPKVETERLP